MSSGQDKLSQVLETLHCQVRPKPVAF